MPKPVVLHSGKSLQDFKKNFFEKKNLSNSFVQIRSWEQCADFFRNKLVSRCLTVGTLTVHKNCFLQQNY